MATESLITKADQPMVANYLRDRVSGPVALETWTRKESGLILTDRDPCEFCDEVVSAARVLASLHPAISVTLYDLDRHASRAEEAKIDRPPVTVARGRHGRELRVVGLWGGLLFPAFMDAIAFLSSGIAPLPEERVSALTALTDDMEIEVLGAPYDPYSAHLLRILGALAVTAPRIRAQFTEVSEFPILASQRAVGEVPITIINGRRFAGLWEADDLAEQIHRVATRNEEPVIRDQVLTNPYMTREQAEEMARQQLATQHGAPGGAAPQPPSASGGLIVPGR